MNLTGIHAEYWRQRKAPIPGWAAGFMPRARVDIDACVNQHSEPKPRRADGVHACDNLLAIIRSHRKHIARTHRGDSNAEFRVSALACYLEGIAQQPGTVCNPEKRAAFARKWAARIRNRARDVARAREE